MEYSIFQKLGFFGPTLLFILTTYKLFYKKIFLFAYIIGYFLNSILNKTIKHIIREPRPKNQIMMEDYQTIEHTEKYAMPSGHAQSVAYSTYFLYMTSNIIWTVFSCFIIILTIYQRYSFNRHTMKQLMIGLIIGLIFSFIILKIAKYYVDTKTDQNIIL